MSHTADGFELLARLRGLERRLRRLRKEWQSFRNQPSRETLSDVRRSAHRLSEALEQLGLSVEQTGVSALAGATLSDSGDVPRDRPAPRDVVAASRDLGDGD